MGLADAERRLTIEPTPSSNLIGGQRRITVQLATEQSTEIVLSVREVGVRL